ncbi:MAG: hypothetical protein AAF721_37765 [Myxococcota bacterium]
MLARSLSIGAGLGLAVGMLGGSGGCKPKTAELYNEDLAVAICEVRRNCPDVTLTSMTGSVTFPDDATCEEAVLNQFEGCGDSCTYRKSYGRRCLRRLKRLAADCEGGSLGPCRRTYRKCDDTLETSRCNLHNCGARIDAPSREGVPWLMLLAVGVWARRRRRSA